MLDEKRWVKLNNFPHSVGDVRGIFEINKTCYVVGNKGISTLNNEFYKYPSNKHYYWCATCRVGDKILTVRQDECGAGESKVFDPVDKQWSDANIETKRRNFALVYYLNLVWIIGGRDDDDDKTYLNSIEIYDPVTKTQALSPIKMNDARYNHSVIVYKKKLFVFGGSGKRLDFRLETVEMFSPTTNKFVMMAPMKIDRSSFACCRVGNLVYVIGGFLCFDYQFKSVEIYDIVNNTWTYGVAFPVRAGLLSVSALNNKL